MKRDWNLIRDILMEIESFNFRDEHVFIIKNSSSDEQLRERHVKLLFEAGFIKGNLAQCIGSWQLLDAELTWQGQELLAHLRSSTIWESVKEKAMGKGVDLSFDAVMKIAGNIINAIS